MPLLANRTESGYTVLSDDGIIAFNVSEDRAREAIYEKYPDAPATEVEEILTAQPNAGEWRSLFATATTSELQKIGDQIMEGGEDTLAIQDRIDQAVAAQAAMMQSLNDLSHSERVRGLIEAQADFDAEVDRRTEAAIASDPRLDINNTRAVATSVIALLWDTPLGDRLENARRRAP